METSSTLCWRCQNAIPDRYGRRGCVWSREFRPVEGWEAEKKILKYCETPRISYVVRRCPQFVEDI